MNKQNEENEISGKDSTEDTKVEELSLNSAGRLTHGLPMPNDNALTFDAPSASVEQTEEK